MATGIRDLWPEDINVEVFYTPREVLAHQAQNLESRTKGILVGQVVRSEAEDRVVLGFEVVARRINKRVRLFEVQHRLDYDYPAAIIAPEQLPRYLREEYVTTQGNLAGIAQHFLPNRTVTNEWIAATPGEFEDKVAKVLAMAGVKASIVSFLAKSAEPRDAIQMTEEMSNKEEKSE